MSTHAANVQTLARELEWFEQILHQRLLIHAGQRSDGDLLTSCPPPPLGEDTFYATLVRELELDAAERLVLMLALAPELRPAALDPLLLHNSALGRRFTEFGGIDGSEHLGLLPTAETALFLLAGDDLARRVAHLRLVDDEHRLYRTQVLRLDRRSLESVSLAATLRVTPEARVRLTTGEVYHPPFSPEFPAALVSTGLEWRDLVVDGEIRAELEDIITWARNQARILDGWRLRDRLTPGYRALFWGPPGTGKTLTAGLIGKVLEQPVYRVDLSQIISKYIGETEKNIAALFDRAQNRDWVLFFDEADALFGERTSAQSSTDRASNQQIAYLLQRFEQFSGVALLATNLVANIDQAFTRRFQAKIMFKLPDARQREQLWRNNFATVGFAAADDVDFEQLAARYELSGGNIVNVLRFACLRALDRDPPWIDSHDLLRGIQREMEKDGRLMA